MIGAWSSWYRLAYFVLLLAIPSLIGSSNVKEGGQFIWGFLGALVFTAPVAALIWVVRWLRA